MRHERMNYTYVGIDSHKETHYAVILDCFCERLGALEIRNAPSSFDTFITKLEKYLLPDTTLLFGFEDISEYGTSLVRYLFNKGFVVKHCNATLVATERKSCNTLHKTDDFDSECVARVLITKFKLLPTCNPKDEYAILKQLVTRRNALTKSCSSLKVQLHRMIAKNYPAYKSFFTVIDGKYSLRFFEKYPSPSTLEGKTEEDILNFFEKFRLVNKSKKAKNIIESINTDGDTKTTFQETTDFIIQSVIRQMKSLDEEVKAIEEKIKEVLNYIPQKLTTIKGINVITCASIIAEIGDISRFSSPAKLSRFAGVAPVVYSSGKSEVMFANEKGNRRLASILFITSVTLSSLRGSHKTALNPILHKYYKKKLSEGKTKKQALKCVQRRLVNIIYSMLKNNTEYINPPTETFAD